MKHVRLICTTLLLMLASFASYGVVGPITGLMTVCVGTTTTLGDTTAGGVWTSSNTSIATVDPSGSVTGIMSGVVTISYTASSTVTATVTVNASPLPIAGPNEECTGANMTLTNATTGGSWSSSNVFVATVSGGVVTGVSAGTASINYTLGYGCSVSTVVTINPLPAPITGIVSLCNGTTATMSNTTPGGVWSSGTGSLSIGSATGIITGISTGSGSISYTLPTGCLATKVLTVLTTPTSITGTTSLCAGSSTVFTNGVSGGTWAVSSPSVASLGTAAGMVTGVAAGVTNITYTIGTGCYKTTTLTVNALPAAITGATGICIGATTTLSNATPGGTWSSANPSVANVNSSGVSTGVAAGSTSISYTLTTGCATSIAQVVYATPAAISGSSMVCAGSSITLWNAATGGTWTSSNPAVATVNATSGTATGITAGVTTITYTLGTGCTVNTSFVVNASPALYSLSGGGSYCAGSAGVHIGLTGSSSTDMYQLYMGTTPVGGVIVGTGGLIDFGMTTSAGTYAVLATNATTGCTRNMSGNPVISVNSQPAPFNVTGGGAICAGSAGAHIGLASSQIGISYQMYNGSSMVGTPITGIGTAIDFGSFTTTGTYNVTATNTSTSCANNMIGSATIATNPLPNAFTVVGGGGYCTGGAGVPVSLSGSDAGINYQLYRGITYTGLQLPGTGSPLDFGYQVNGGNYTIKATDATTGCQAAMTSSANVAVNPLPVIFTITSTPLSGGYCTGGSGVHINLSLSTIGVNYQLYHAGTAVGAPIPGTGSTLDFGLQTAAGTYTAIALNPVTTCTVNMAGSGSVNIYPLPAIHSVTGGGSYCGGTAGVPVGISVSDVGISYQLYVGGIPVGAPVLGSGSSLNFGLQTTPGTYTVVGSNPGTSCSSNMLSSAIVNVIAPVIPNVILNSAPGDTVCAGTTVSFTTTTINGGTSPTYQWTVNGTVVGSGIAYSYVPANNDIVAVSMNSSEACASAPTVTDFITMTTSTVPAITGPTAICIGSSVVLTDTLPGGTWSTSNPAVALVSIVGGTPGVVTGVAAGTVNMTYTMGSGCFTYATVTVSPLPFATASATPASCGSSFDLTAGGGTNYSWLPSTGLACSTCAVTTADPNYTTTYTVTVTNAGGCTGTATVNINANRILGHISYTGISSDVFKVWLIQFQSTDSSLIGIDSTYTCMDGGTPYFEFAGKPAGNYMVKAALVGAVPGTSGYIPTYSLSTPYWYNAASVAHNTATDTLHINMVYGTVPPGPGFIGGLISAGAGKGTAGDAAVKGMIVYLVDAVSNFILTYTYTDESGHYSFSNIGYGNYIIYPENYSFKTIPSSVIMLGGGSDSSNNNNFKQYNNSKVIKPVIPSGIEDIGRLTYGASSLLVYPNPASEQLNIRWGVNDYGRATITILDLTGQIVSATEVNIDDLRSGTTSPIVQSTLDVSRLAIGMYMVSIKGDHLQYTGKVVIR